MKNSNDPKKCLSDLKKIATDRVDNKQFPPDLSKFDHYARALVEFDKNHENASRPKVISLDAFKTQIAANQPTATPRSDSDRIEAELKALPTKNRTGNLDEEEK